MPHAPTAIDAMHATRIQSSLIIRMSSLSFGRTPYRAHCQQHEQQEPHLISFDLFHIGQAKTPGIVGQGFQTDAAPALVDMGFILDRREAQRLGTQLTAI